MKSLADVFRHLVHDDQAYDGAPQPAVYYLSRHRQGLHPEIMLLSQKRDEHSSQAHPPQAPPSRQEVLNYLG